MSYLRVEVLDLFRVVRLEESARSRAHDVFFPWLYKHKVIKWVAGIVVLSLLFGSQSVKLSEVHIVHPFIWRRGLLRIGIGSSLSRH
jgi:hypothetical protein